jgi:transcriptional regulator with XRE-family HTH domain
MSALVVRKRNTPPDAATRARPQPSSRLAPSGAAKSVADSADRIVAVATKDEERASSIAPIMSAVAVAAEAPMLGLDALLAALQAPEIWEQLSQEAPLLRARLRGIRAKQRLLQAEGGVVTGQELADLVGISRQAVDKRRRNGTLIGLSLGKKGYLYPVWQADIDGLKPVLAALREYGPWTQAIFMLTPNSWLGGETPLSMLRQGETQAATAAASMYGEQAASSIVQEPGDPVELPDRR